METQVKIFYSNPFSTEKNIGKAYNEFCESCPDDAWICLQDGDMMYLTPDWGKQIEDVILKHGNKYQLYGCVTNRLGRNIQIADGVDYDNHDIKYHTQKAFEIKDMFYGQVEDITKKRYIAGLFMIFHKSTWQKHKFEENTPYFDDYFSKKITQANGKLGLIKGLYVYHQYRIWSDNPKVDNKHLI